MINALTRFSGFADEYDSARPTPPVEIIELLSQYAGTPAPTVVDLGAGTGLATALWFGRAERVYACEPNPDMAAVLSARLAETDGYTVHPVPAEDTGLPARFADVVTASQAMHWFDLDRALPEIARILRPGGVFAAFDCDWPPTVHPEVDAAYTAFENYYRGGEKQTEPPRAPKHLHLQRMRESGQFTFTTEIALHNKESGDAERLLAVANSQGGVVALKRSGVTDEQLGLDKLAAVAREHLSEPCPWWWTYRIRIGVR